MDQIPSHALSDLPSLGLCFVVTRCLLHIQASSSHSRQEEGERSKGKRHGPDESFFISHPMAFPETSSRRLLVT